MATLAVTRRFDLSDAQWAVMCPLLPGVDTVFDTTLAFALVEKHVPSLVLRFGHDSTTPDGSL